MAKVAEGTYREANQRGILTEYIAFTLLKDIVQSQGTIRRDAESLSAVASKLGKSLPTLRRYLTVLVNNGFAKRNRYTYSLVSYDTAWEMLGVDMTYNKSKKRKGSFAIFKTTEYKTIESLKIYIEYREVVLNQKRQTWVIRNEIRGDKTKYSDTEKKRLEEIEWCDVPEVLDSMYLDSLKVLDEVEKSVMNSTKIAWEEKTKKNYNSQRKYRKLTPFLTCSGTAELLGYSSGLGSRIRRRIETLGRCRWEERKVRVCTPKTHSEHKRTDRLVNLRPNQFHWDGMSLWITAISLFYFT